MRSEKMELNIYLEYVENVKSGKYNGLVVLEELQKGDFLNEMKAKSLDPGVFERVSLKVQQDMLEGMEKEIARAPFFVRGRIRSAKFGDSILTVNISKNVVSSVNKRITQLNTVLDELKTRDESFLSKLNAMVERGKVRSLDGEKRLLELGKQSKWRL